MTQCKVITFWSPVAGVGTTLTAINTASRLVKKGLKVLLMDFDLPNPTIPLYFQSQSMSHGIDTLLPHVASNQLSMDVLESSLLDFEGLKVLRGSNSPEKSHFIQVEQLQYILEVAKQMFDYIIIDTKGFIDNAGSFVGITESNPCVVVMDKSVISLQKYRAIQPLLQASFDMNKFILLINKRTKHVHLESKDVEEFMNFPTSFELPLLSADFLNAINQGKWMNFLENGDKSAKEYVAALDHFIEQVVVSDFLKMKDKKPSLLRFFGK